MSSSYHQFPPSSPVLHHDHDHDDDLSDENNSSLAKAPEFFLSKKKQFFNNQRITDNQQHEYPTPNPSSSLGYLPSSSTGEGHDGVSSPIKNKMVFEDEYHEDYQDNNVEQEQPSTALKLVQQQQEESVATVAPPVNQDKKKVNFNLDLNETNLITSTASIANKQSNSTDIYKNINAKQSRVKFINPYSQVRKLRILKSNELGKCHQINIGRSSRLNQLSLNSHNKLISRVHCSIKYLPDLEHGEDGQVQLSCIGWNGINVTIPGLIDVIATGDKSFVITPRQNTTAPSSDLESGNDSDDEHEEGLNENLKDESGRIISRDSALTNFYIMKGESFKMPLIKGVLLDIRDELVLLEYEDDLEVTDDEKILADDAVNGETDTVVKDVELVHSIVEDAKPVETMEAAKLVEAIEVTKPVEINKPFENIKSAEVVKSIEGSPKKHNPTGLSKPIELTKVPINESTPSPTKDPKKFPVLDIPMKIISPFSMGAPNNLSLFESLSTPSTPKKLQLKSKKAALTTPNSPMDTVAESTTSIPTLKRSLDTTLKALSKEGEDEKSISIKKELMESTNLLNVKPAKQRGRPHKSQQEQEDKENVDNTNNTVIDESNDRAIKKQKIIKKSNEISKEESEKILNELQKELPSLTNILINHLAYSRILQTPLNQILNLTAIKSHNLNKLQIRCILNNYIECIGVINRVGKDAAGKPLDEEYYYIPEKDQDQNRVKLVEELKGSASHLRSCRKTHKQYFWKKPAKK